MEPTVTEPAAPRSFVRRHRTAIIGGAVAFLVIGGATAGAAAIGHSIDHTVSQIGAATASAKPVTKAPTVKVTPLPAPAPKPFDPSTVKVGDVVPQHVQLPDGFYPFQMPDNTRVAVNQEQPLPAAVQTALQQQAAAMVHPNTPGVAGDAGTFMSDAWAGTGKYVVVIAQTTGASGPGLPMTQQWFAMSSDWNPATAAPTEAQAQAAAEARIAASADPGRYAIVVVQ
jgi:hypothetical protein